MADLLINGKSINGTNTANYKQLTFRGMPVAASKGKVQGIKEFEFIFNGEPLELATGDRVRFHSFEAVVTEVADRERFDKRGIGAGALTETTTLTAMTPLEVAQVIRRDEVDAEWREQKRREADVERRCKIKGCDRDAVERRLCFDHLEEADPEWRGHAERA